MDFLGHDKKAHKDLDFLFLKLDFIDLASVIYGHVKTGFFLFLH